MGNNPIPPPPKRARPTRESFHLGMARSAYIEGRIEVDDYERCVEIVLAGGQLPQRVTGSQFPRPMMEKR